ncbi:MAG: 1-acyl-sn-glycerol-3-phosphate acyltransferase [Oscillospiraceae bacterium]|nr:1-acyl-sn-glycerol-3-phosphate acyltransferase [Oscillospiraceae bacterium]
MYNFNRIKPYVFYRVMKHPLSGLIRLLFKLEVHGRENLPAKADGVIIACNHRHAADPGFLVAATGLCWRFMAKQELFRSGASRWACTHFNAFPVRRRVVVDRQAIDFAVDVLQDGRAGLGIFPEGTRSDDGKLLPGKHGAAVLARKTHSDVLPCSLYWEGKLGRGTRVTVRIGQVIPFAQLGMEQSPNKRENAAATAKIMAAIGELRAQGHG